MKNNNYNEDIDALISKKFANKIQDEMNAADATPEFINISDLQLVPENQIFSTEAVYLVFNRTTHQKTFITGQQAESLIGLYADIRRSLAAKLIDNFTINEYYVKFHQIRLPA